MKKQILTIILVGLSSIQLNAQFWNTIGLNNGGNGNTFGTSNGFPINIYTNSEFTSFFSVGNGLNGLNGTGDGLRIRNSFPGATPGLGEIDIFTSGTGSNGTEIRFGGSGNIRGANNRFEIWGNYNGLFYNTSTGSGVHKFARSGAVTGFIGTNNFWRIGMQADAANINANRRLEVVDNDWQFRLSRVGGTSWTDFQSNGAGNLQVLPQGGRVGINLGSNPTATLDVNGDARIRNVQQATPDALFVGVQAAGASDLNVRRLDFTGDANDVLLGDGTWGTIPNPPVGPIIGANNGCSKVGNNIQLGEPYNVPKTVQLLGNREVFLNARNFIFSGKGSVGIGLDFPVLPSEVLDVNGNGRFRDVPEQGGQSLILGLQQGATPDDIELSRLAFPNDDTQVLLGDGTWGTASGSNGMIQPTIDCSTGVLTLGIENVDTVSVNLSCLMGSGGTGAVHNGLSTSTTLPGYFALGQNLGGTGGQLLNNREVPMNNFNISFTNNGLTTYGNNEVGIGLLNPQAKLHVDLNSSIITGTTTYAAKFDNNATSAFGVGSLVTMSNHASLSYGYEANINATTNSTSQNQGFRTFIEGGLVNEGLHVWVKDGTNGNTGVYALATSQNTNANQTVGVIGLAYDGGNANKGGDFRGISQTGNPLNNYGVFALAGGTAVNSYGIYASATGGTTSNYAGYFTGPIYAGGLIVGSDENLKTNIAPLNNGMSLINQLEPKTFEFDQIGHPSMSLSSGLQYGLIAQEVEQIIPEIVSENTQPAVLDSLGNISIAEVQFKGLEYEQLIPIMIKGMQEQDDRIDSLTNLNCSVTNYNDSLVQVVSDLNERLTNLENCLSNILQGLCNANQQAVSQTPEEIQEQLRSIIDVELSDKNSIVLNQNVPNPFAERTLISYSVPSSVHRAQIHFYDMNGVLINSVDITERGEGQINVYANDLSSGIYTYSLVADGKVVSTKKMMKN